MFKFTFIKLFHHTILKQLQGRKEKKLNLFNLKYAKEYILEVQNVYHDFAQIYQTRQHFILTQLRCTQIKGIAL